VLICDAAEARLASRRTQDWLVRARKLLLVLGQQDITAGQAASSPPTAMRCMTFRELKDQGRRHAAPAATICIR
jgi:hypothetical protein